MHGPFLRFGQRQAKTKRPFSGSARASVTDSCRAYGGASETTEAVAPFDWQPRCLRFEDRWLCVPTSRSVCPLQSSQLRSGSYQGFRNDPKCRQAETRGKPEYTFSRLERFVGRYPLSGGSHAQLNSTDSVLVGSVRIHAFGRAHRAQTSRSSRCTG